MSAPGVGFRAFLPKRYKGILCSQDGTHLTAAYYILCVGSYLHLVYSLLR